MTCLMLAGCLCVCRGPRVAWNTQVAHILATCSANGSTIIWDLRQKKPWCELRDAQRCAVTDIAWNPDEGQNIVTASGNDDNPVSSSGQGRKRQSTGIGREAMDGSQSRRDERRRTEACVCLITHVRVGVPGG